MVAVFDLGDGLGYQVEPVVLADGLPVEPANAARVRVPAEDNARARMPDRPPGSRRVHGFEERCTRRQVFSRDRPAGEVVESGFDGGHVRGPPVGWALTFLSGRRGGSSADRTDAGSRARGE